MGRGADIREKRDRCRHGNTGLDRSTGRASGSYVGIQDGQQDVERNSIAAPAGIDLSLNQDDAGTFDR